MDWGSIFKKEEIRQTALLTEERPIHQQLICSKCKTENYPLDQGKKCKSSASCTIHVRFMPLYFYILHLAFYILHFLTHPPAYFPHLNKPTATDKNQSAQSSFPQKLPRSRCLRKLSVLHLRSTTQRKSSKMDLESAARLR